MGWVGLGDPLEILPVAVGISSSATKKYDAMKFESVRTCMIFACWWCTVDLRDKKQKHAMRQYEAQFDHDFSRVDLYNSKKFVCPQPPPPALGLSLHNW